MNLQEEIKKSFPRLEKLFCDEELAAFTNTPPDEIALYHFTLGAWIRNNLLYPPKSPLYCLFLADGILRPDDMSGHIIRQFYEYLQNRDEI